MAKFRLPINQFLLGEVSSKFYGRYDIREISHACRNLLNSFVRVQGGAFRRPGSRFVTNQGIYSDLSAKNLAENAKLIPWVVSKDESYVLMLSTYHANTTYPSPFLVYRLSNEAWCYVNNIDGNYSVDFFTLSTTQLKDIKYAQFGDTMVLAHPLHPPMSVYRVSSSIFKFSVSTDRPYPYGTNPPSLGNSESPTNGIGYYNTIPFFDNTNISATLKVSATTGTGVTLTCNQDLFSIGHVKTFTYSIPIGARFRLFDPGSGKYGICEITAYVDAQHATVSIDPANPMGSTNYTSVWQESAWSDYRGWPRSVTFHQNRLVYGGNTTFPNTLWFSQLDDIYEMARPAVGSTDNDAFTAVIATGELNAIQWLASNKTLVVGTLGQEIIIEGNNINEAVSNSNFSASPETGYGSEYVRPVRVDNALLFVQRSGLKVREFQFNFQEDAYTSRDLNRFADHITLKAYDYYASVTTPKIIEMAYQGGDNPMVWILDNNGVLSALMRDKESTVLAWTPVKLGGNFGGEPPVVISMCSVASINGLDDELWIYVKRTVNSSTVYFLERITKEFFGPDLDQGECPSSHFYPYYLDCAINQTLGSPGTVFNGFTRLNGETINVIADGQYVGTKTVSGNIITLSSNATTITAGYTYQSIISPILPDAGSIIGTAVLAIRRIHEIAIRFRRTVAAKFGRSTSSGKYEEIIFRDASVVVNEPTPLFDGIKTRTFKGEYDRDPQVVIFQDDPLPMEVSYFSGDGMTYD